MKRISRPRAAIAEWVHADFGIALAELELIVGGLDPDARVWRASDTGGGEWAVKWTSRDNRLGLELVRGLSDDGAAGIPVPLSTRDGRSWSERQGGVLTVTTWIRGRDAFETGLEPAEWQAFGALLRRIHRSGAHGPGVMAAASRTPPAAGSAGRAPM